MANFRVDIDEDLKRQVMAMSDHTSISAAVEEGLRLILERKRRERAEDGPAVT